VGCHELVQQICNALPQRDAVLLKAPEFPISLIVLVQPSHFDGYAAIEEKIGRNLAVRLMDNFPDI
jgi:hypothetical protein